MPVELWVGKNQFLIDQRLNSLKEEFGFEYEELKFEKIKDVLYPPTFLDKKASVIVDFENNKEQKTIYDFIDKIPATNLVVLLIGELRKDNPLYDEIKRKGKIFTFDDPKPAEVASFIFKKAKEFNVKWESPEVEQNFVFLVGSDLQNINTELLKFRNLTVTESLLEGVARSRQMIVFDLVNQILSKDYTSFYISVEYFLQDGQDLAYLITLLLKQFRSLIIVKSGGDSKTLATNLKLSPYVVKILINQAKKFNITQLMRIYIGLEGLLYQLRVKQVQERPIFITNILLKELG